MSLDAIFGTDQHLNWAQECGRAVVIFAYGLALVRLSGRRVFGKWSALDIVVSVIVGSNLSRALTGSAPLIGTVAATTLLMALHWVLAQAAARSEPLSRILEGSPVKLSEGGANDRPILVRHAISPGDLDESLRQSGVESLDESRLVTLEPSGKITVLKAR